MEEINKMSDEIKQKTTLEEIKQRGGLAFPLDYEDISVLDATYIGAYIVTLQNGAAVIYDPKSKNNISGDSNTQNIHGSNGWTFKCLYG
jgi:hypothetical protein